jgi:DNA repair protein RecN (Recombination protein N)
LLTYLSVSDFALVDNIEIDFRPGLNILTGETGAGKTVLIGAIGLLLGDRADSMQVRHGADAARFSAVFDLSPLPRVRERLQEAGYIGDGEQELMLGRSVSKDGKSKCTVNGRLGPVSALSEIGDLIVEVHGQNTHQALLKTGTHLQYLDRFAGTEHLSTLQSYRERHSRWRSLIAELSEIKGDGRDLESEIELLSEEIDGIEKVDPREGEDKALEADAKRMRNTRELWELSSRVEKALVGDDSSTLSTREFLTQAVKDLRGMAAYDDSVEENAGRLESLIYETEDIAADVAEYRKTLDTDPAALQEVESRLSLLRDLFRRYGGSVEAVAAYREEATERLQKLQEMIQRASVIDADIESERQAVQELDEELVEGRKKASARLSKEVVRELKQLELAGASFDISVVSQSEVKGNTDTVKYGPSGSCEVEFLFCADKVGPARPLNRIASGGEMSRVMLALKIVLAGADMLPVLVFDEVDAGIGGETAGAVGEKLRQLTRHHQVFCITHIPQIATYADWQYKVSKGETADGARTRIELLDDEGRVEEMCRMLGDASGRKVTREHALDMLKRAKKKV